MSLAAELEKLHELFQKEILTAEEFKEAKAAAMAKHRGQPAASTSGSVVALPPPEPAGAATSAVPQHSSTSGLELLRATPCHADTSGFVESGSGAHRSAYQHLKTILRNILNSPTDPKYRKLRLANDRLTAELFSSPAAVRFLSSIGFEKFDANDPIVVAQVAACGGVPLQRGEGLVYVLNGPPDVPLLAAALQSLEALERRDDSALEAMRSYSQQFRSVGQTLRRERWVEATAKGEILQFVASEILRNSLDDAVDLIGVLRRILQNIVDNPADDRFRVLKSSNPKVRSLIATFGSLEFLCAVAGFLYTSDGLQLPADRSAADVQRCIATSLEQIAAVVEQRRQAEQQIQAALAAESALRERNNLQMEETRKRQTQRSSRSFALEEELNSGDAHRERKRIPIDDALRYLVDGFIPSAGSTAELPAGPELATPPHIREYIQEGGGTFDIRSLVQERRKRSPGA